MGTKKLLAITKNRNREDKLSMSDQLLIVILYHFEVFKDFKYYYKYALGIKAKVYLDKCHNMIASCR